MRSQQTHSGTATAVGVSPKEASIALSLPDRDDRRPCSGGRSGTNCGVVGRTGRTHCRELNRLNERWVDKTSCSCAVVGACGSTLKPVINASRGDLLPEAAPPLCKDCGSGALRIRKQSSDRSLSTANHCSERVRGFNCAPPDPVLVILEAVLTANRQTDTDRS